MAKIDLIIDALLVAPPSVWSKKMDEALFVARELKAELEVNATALYALDSAEHLADSTETFGNRKWVGLTENERFKIATEMGALSACWIEFAFEIEKHVRLKNT